jgi:hypothetical protein
MRVPLAVIGGVMAGAGLAIGVVEIVAAVSASASKAWSSSSSAIGVLGGLTLLGLGVGLMVAASIYNKK